MQSESEIIRVLEEFRAKNPWQGRIAERKEKFEWCFNELLRVIDADTDGWIVKYDIPDRFSEWHSSEASCVNFKDRTLTLSGRLSVITLLHEFGHIYQQKVGVSFDVTNVRQIETDSQSFATYFFSKVFPDKMRNLRVADNGLLVKRSGNNESENQHC